VQQALHKQQTEYTQKIQQVEMSRDTLQSVLHDVMVKLSTALEAPLPDVVHKERQHKKPAVSPAPTHPAQPPVSHVLPMKQRYATPNGAERMLRMLVLRHPMKLTKVQLATLSNLSPQSGSHNRYLRLLREQGLISITDGLITLTASGQRQLQSTPKPQTSEKTIDLWRKKLPSGAQRMFDCLIKGYPGAYTRDQIGVQAALSPRSGSFGRYLRILRNNGLISVQGNNLKASETLFL